MGGTDKRHRRDTRAGRRRFNSGAAQVAMNDFALQFKAAIRVRVYPPRRGEENNPRNTGGRGRGQG